MKYKLFWSLFEQALRRNIAKDTEDVGFRTLSSTSCLTMDSFYQRKFKVHGFNKEDVQSIQPSINKQRRQLLHPMDAYLSHVMSNDASRMSASSVSVPYTERIETSGTGISSTTPLSGHAFTLLGSPDSHSPPNNVCSSLTWKFPTKWAP